MVEFTLFRIPVRVEVSFWITLGLIGVLFNQRHPEDLLALAGLFVFAAFVSILIHELGHALMVRKFGMPTAIVLASFGGYATYPVGVMSRKQSFIVTLAGPLLQAMAGLLCWYIFEYHVELPDNKITVLKNDFVTVSIIWAIFNCLPILPLDGGRMVEAALGPRRIKATLIISIATAIIIGVLGVMNGYILSVIFMAMFGWQNYQAYQQLK